jgi:YkoY family integral membrane protein
MLAFALWGQEAAWGDLGIVGLLVLLEGVLSIDNALVLGLLAKRLPKRQQKKALTYGLVGAFAFRFLAIAVASFLLQWTWVKLVGGGYLAYIAIKHLFFERHEDHGEHVTTTAEGEPTLVGASGAPLTSAEEAQELKERISLPLPEQKAVARGRRAARFWPTVFVIELTDIAFAVDSILAAIALVGPPPPGAVEGAVHPKLWVIITGGILGVILMRFAAVIFIRLLERFPRFESAAYLLVAAIGTKLLLDWGFNTAESHVKGAIEFGGRRFEWAFNSHEQHLLDFHSLWDHAGNVNHEFWIFWVTMILCFLTGFIPSKRKGHAAQAAEER